MSRRWWPVAVRRSTALAAAVLCALVFTVGWLGTRGFLAAQLDGNARNSAVTELNRMAAAYQVATVDGGRSALASAVTNGDAMFEVVTDSGQSVVRSQNLRQLDPAWTTLPPTPRGVGADWTTSTTVTLRPGENPHWREYRTYEVLSRVVDGVPAALAEPLGREETELSAGLGGGSAQSTYRLTLHLFVLPWDTQRALRSFDTTLGYFVPIAVLLTALAAWFSAGRALRPVEAIRRELAEVSATGLDRRVPVPPSGDEITRLALTTNSTLDRLQRSHQQQERFVADASHELRSPLASLRASLEVALAHPDRADWPAVAQRSLLDVQRLQRITADLLQLAAQTGQPLNSGVVDLADLVLEQVAERSAEPGRRVVVRSEIAGAAPVNGVQVQLERLLRNLVDNAVRHAEAEVTVRLSIEAAGVVLEVRDDGPGIPIEDSERVFDRFARLDDARTRDEGGSGLGLALARDIALRHGGTLCVEDSETGARLVARFPATND